MTSFWNNVALSTSSGVVSAIPALGNYLRSLKRHSVLKYSSSRAYKNVELFEAQRIAFREASNYARQLITKPLTTALEKAKQENQKIQQAAYKTLIEEGKKSLDIEDLPLTCADKSIYYYQAKDIAGERVPEALFLSYEGDEPYSLTNNEEGGTTYNVLTVFHCDITPNVSMNSDKNIVLTRVQGRDYSRKELISGGDLSFTVEGEINSNKMGVYPAAAVARFIKIMQYNGIIDVSHFMFNSLNVSRIVIQDYSLSKPTYKNIQPYKFSCVAVEPDEDVKLQADTIGVINSEIVSAQQSGWFKSLLLNTSADIVETGLGDLIDFTVSKI